MTSASGGVSILLVDSRPKTYEERCQAPFHLSEPTYDIARKHA